MATIIFLHTEKHPPIPDAMENCHLFGPETIRDEKGNCHEGISVAITGTEDQLKDYFRQCGPVWTSTNPMVGSWTLNT